MYRVEKEVTHSSFMNEAVTWYHYDLFKNGKKVGSELFNLKKDPGKDVQYDKIMEDINKMFCGNKAKGLLTAKKYIAAAKRNRENGVQTYIFHRLRGITLDGWITYEEIIDDWLRLYGQIRNDPLD